MIEAIILCGGLGKRLRSIVPDTQKVIANVQDRPFLTFIIDELIRQKINRVILCLGYKSEDVISLIEEEYKNQNVIIDYSVEEYPLGTGGAVNLARKKCVGDNLLLLNGDTFNKFSVNELVAFHQNENNDVSMLVKEVKSVSRYGAVKIDSNQNVISFSEKDLNDTNSGLINAGIYILSKKIFKIYDREVFSLEKNLLPMVIGRKFKALKVSGTFIDIGIPEDYKKANRIVFGS